jgi:hypothetical protein
MVRRFDLSVSFLVGLVTKHETIVTLDHVGLAHRFPSYPYGALRVSKSQKLVVFENKTLYTGLVSYDSVKARAVATLKHCAIPSCGDFEKERK